MTATLRYGGEQRPPKTPLPTFSFSFLFHFLSTCVLGDILLPLALTIITIASGYPGRQNESG